MKLRKRFAETVFMPLQATIAALPVVGVRRWASAGALIGIALAMVRFAPASWAADALSSATNGQLLLADAQGTVWDGNALPVLTGGAGSRESLALPSRLEWTLRPSLSGLQLTLTHACCMPQPLRWALAPGWSQQRLTLIPPPQAGALIQWPANWLTGLGTPWNTLQPGGLIQVSSPGMNLEWAQGRWRLDGDATIEVMNASSRISTLDTLGSYRLAISGHAAKGGATTLTLSTLEGALQLSGTGQGTPTGFRFRGEARAAPGQEGALNNLLNIIGRRNGATSVISIG